MDYLAKKKQFVFLNNRLAIVRVHVTQINSKPYEIWVEGKSKKYRDCVQLLNKNIKNFKKDKLPPIVIVENKKIGSGGISSYNHDDDLIYFNSYYHSQERIDEITKNNTFAAKDLTDIIQHELGHKQHWDAIKRFYNAHKSHYNNIYEAKNQLDSNLENYIARQGITYIASTISIYAARSYEYAKNNNKNNLVNEIIAEERVKPSTDPNINKIIESELNYGKS